MSDERAVDIQKIDSNTDQTSIEGKNEHEKALVIVDETKKIIQNAQKQVNECMLLLKDDLENFEKSKQELRESALSQSEELLLELGFESDMLHTQEEAKIDIETVQNKAQEGAIEVQEILSGKLSSFLIGVLFALLLAVGLLYLALEATQTPWRLMGDSQYLTVVLSWIGEKSLSHANMFTGATVLVVVSMLFGYLVYTIRVSLRASKNLRVAQQIHQEAQFYCTQKDECKIQMEKVDAHINETIEIINVYKLLLQEQNMRLRRILLIEEKQEFESYHYKSQADMENTQRLVNGILELLSTPIAAQGSLSSQAQEALAHAKRVINHHIKAIYDKNIDDIF
ncbi:MAG: hypothetical protein KU38_05440 [Sulfurovum sp. FS08-3]|nr:MAG: hypothetical protein KU38_05440 [Sulfurovum sp. FS08-3]